MLRFGEALYRLTKRDEETLLVDPFYREINATASGAGTQGVNYLAIPVDRCLYIKSVYVGLVAVPAFSWTSWELQVAAVGTAAPIFIAGKDPGSLSLGLVSDGNSAYGVNQNIRNWVPVDQVFPPGIGSLRFIINRAGGVADGTGRVQIQGYLIPPGRIGRVGFT